RTRMAKEPARRGSQAVSEIIVCTGDPFSTILTQSIDRSADLIIIGAPGKHRYADIFMGTTAERVIRFSDKPVLMVKQAPGEPYRRILVAFDGSEGAIRGLQMALAIAPGAEFRVVHAWWPPHVSLGESDAARDLINEDNRRLKSLIEEAATKAIPAGGTRSAVVTIDMVENNPYLVMKNELAWPDLLVMGTHSKGRLASTVTIGHLARHLLAESPCDVLTSRP